MMSRTRLGRPVVLTVLATGCALGLAGCRIHTATAAATHSPIATTPPVALGATASRGSSASAPASAPVSTAASAVAGSAGDPSPSCASSGTTIPAGHYAGPIKVTLTTTLHLDTSQATIPDAGSGTEVLTGSVDITSTGATVTGSITLTGLGLSQVGLPSSVQVHSVDNGGMNGQISGSAASPVVTGTLSGEWASLDAPLGNTTGSATTPVHAGLHVTQAGCSAVTGDAVAMFTEIAAPVTQYLTFGGSGRWTARRT